MSFSALLDDYASQAPTPGGGTAAAMAGATGYALLEMACGVAAKKASGTDLERLNQLASDARRGRAALLAAMTADSEAYEGIRAASKKIKEQSLSGTEAAALRSAATRTASGVPLSVARECATGIRLARTVLKQTRPATRSDVGVAVALFRAGTLGASYNVLINLDSSLTAAERIALSRGASGAHGAAEHDAAALGRRLARQTGLKRPR